MRSHELLRRFLESSSIAASLEERGFVRSRLTWTRTQPGIAHVVDFQRSRYDDPGTVCFTINLGVALDDVWRAYDGSGLARKIDEAVCFPRFRVGEVLDGSDVWWTIPAGGAGEKLITEVKTSLFGRCVPILDRLSDLDAVFRFVRDEAPPKHPYPFTSISLAIVFHLHGEVDEAESILRALESNPRVGEGWRARIGDVRARLRPSPP